MKRPVFLRALSLLLAMMLTLGMVPNAFATQDSTATPTGSEAAPTSEDGFVSETHDVFSRTTSTIAPGVTQDICYAYAKDGKQMVYYVATADITRDDVDVYANYKDNQCAEFGMAKLTEQIASAQAKHSDPTDTENYIEYYNVVAGTNADFYNMTTGRPTGAFVMEGTVVNTANNRPFFAILENGKAVIGSGDADWNTYMAVSPIVEAVGGSQVLVKDGVDVTASASGSYNTDRHSRTCVGVTADGKVVMMVLDGRQEPFSCGGSMHELAQIMLEAGCVAAINLDGGGSTTFAARQEGEDEVSIVNRPSDGSERSISSSLMIVSTAVPSDTFDHAALTAEESYVTPGSTVNVSAVGVSPAGTSADIPADVSWQLADSTYGTVENGVFTSNGTAGDVVVQMVYAGNVVGSTTIHVVVPETIAFSSEVITVPYGKTVTLEMTATYGLNKVAMKAGDVSFTLSNPAAGTVDGFSFTGCAENAEITGTEISAVLTFNETVTAAATVTLGKGSEVIYDFEDGVNPGIYAKDGNYNYVAAAGETYMVNAATGKVHSGSNALALHLDYSNSLESGYQRNSLYISENIHLQNATTFGMWIYIPDEAVGLWARFVLYPITSYQEDGTPVYGSSITGEIIDGTITGKTGYVSTFQESGWHYISIDLSGYEDVMVRSDAPMMQFYISDRDGIETFGYDFSDYASVNSDFVFYIDDITVDYSSAVDDRDAPVFSSVVYADPVMSDAVELKGQTTSYNTLSFTATVDDNKTKNNYTGIDGATAKAYVDGNEVACEYANGKITLEGIELADGEHTIKFAVCDKQGNYASAIRTINVQANSGKSTVKVVAHDGTQDRILLGSLYYVDVVATDIEKVDSVTVELDLNNISVWNLDHMDVTDGFEAAYAIVEDENIATVTITRTGEVTATGEAALVSMPIRTWEWGYTIMTYGNYKDKTITYAQWKSLKEFWPIDISVEIDRGTVTFTDGTTGTFSGSPIQVDTEMWADDADMISTAEGLAYYNAWNGGHEHRAEHGGTPTALEDKAATCTESGYTGRTYCEECQSVVDWGTTIPATGHTYELVDGVLKCSCGELLNGEYEGKFYVDGVLAQGWIGESYYADGVKFTGIQLVDGCYYNFGEDGVCAGKMKYTGFIIDETGIRYSAIGTLATGWMDIDGDYYFFYSNGYAETESLVYYAGQPYYFDETGKLISGFWHHDGVGTKYYYGPSYYNHEWAEIDGSTYYFDSNGHRLEGWNYIIESGTNPPQWYEFSAEGVLLQKLTSTGLFEANGKLYYTENGISKYGLILAEDGYYYYFKSSDYSAVKSCTYWVSRPNDTGIPAGSYEFDANGRMIIETEEVKNGIVEEDGELYYYVDGVKTYAGLIIIDGDYYYVNSSYKVVTTSHYWVNKTNDLLPAGFYDFGPDGKMIREEEEVKNGIVEEDGALYYYVDGVKTYAGLIIIDGDYYYVNSSCKVVTTSHYWVYKTNGLLPEGFYDFGTDGKMIVEKEEETKNGIVEEDGVLYYYVDGVKTYAGLIIIDGDYYYVNSSYKVVTTSHYWVTKTNDLLPAGFYDFGTDGKMIR